MNPSADDMIIEPMEVVETAYDESEVAILETDVIVSNPSVDPEAMLSGYSGRGKVDRLIFIAKRAPSLAIEALRLALAELRQSEDTTRFVAVSQELHCILANQGIAPTPKDLAPSDPWVEQTRRAVQQHHERLEMDLKNYAANMIKESVRMGYNDLAEHFYRVGDLANALKFYGKTRDYCTTPKHIIDMTWNQIVMNLELGYYAQIHGLAAKIESIQDSPDKLAVMAKVNLAVALASIHGKQYAKAAKTLLKTVFGAVQQQNILSTNDIAIYGALCSLATLERSEIKTLLSTTDFRQFLELEPTIRELVDSFLASNYNHFVNLIKEVKPDLYLHLHLAAHVNELFSQIQKKALLQYLQPFSTVHLGKLASAFKIPDDELEKQLVDLIATGKIRGKIDKLSKAFHYKSQHHRSATFHKVFNVCDYYQQAADSAVLRMNLVKNGLVVKSN